MSASAVLSIISAVFALARMLVSYADQQKWMEQGAAEVILKSLKESDDAILRAKNAREAVRVGAQRDPASVLRDDDGFRRSDD